MAELWFFALHLYPMRSIYLQSLKLISLVVLVLCPGHEIRNGQTNQPTRGPRGPLGRSPEENVKGHSGANNREPQGHNLNNFGRGPFDDVIY